ncbi:MAG: hypothetical protein ACRD2P_05100 [Terriglobia bacterium]
MATKRKIVIAAVALVIVLLIGIRLFRRPKARAPFAPQPAHNGPCVDFRQATSRVGENGCVRGYVLRAYTSKAGNTFLDFCQDYRSCPFTSVIFASDHTKFGNLETLEGRQVELHGFISTYHDQAEIIIHDPAQIQVAQ